MATPKEKLNQIDVRLTQLANSLERQHSLYEQYFAGVLKREPVKEHQDLKTLLNSISPADLKTTAAKFKYQGIQQRYVQFQNFWSKVLKQIEEGTHKRDLFLLEKKIQAKAEPQVTEKAPNTQTSVKTNKSLELLYEKMSQLVKEQDNLPPKEKFVAALQKQIDDQKKKNPDKRVEIKLQKDANGQVQVRLSLQKKK